MCGRFSLIAPPEAIRALFGVAEFDERLVPPRYNIAPTQPIAVVREGEGGRELHPVRWGFIPGWARNPDEMPLMINARAEGIADKASFRNAVRRRRCLVPASGFYEWRARPKGTKGAKTPYWIRPRNGGLIAFAGVWETWAGADGEIDTAAIVTTDANAALRPIHPRVPVVVPPDDFDLWLARDAPVEAALTLLTAPPDDLLEATPVSTRVNAVANDDPGLQEPAEAEDGGEAGRDGADRDRGTRRDRLL
jgi:putative SOS response-associated peptidase YedK